MPSNTRTHSNLAVVKADGEPVDLDTLSSYRHLRILVVYNLQAVVSRTCDSWRGGPRSWQMPDGEVNDGTAGAFHLL